MAPFKEINIPQKPPMVMVGHLIETGGQTTVTSMVIRGDNIFCYNGEFREPGLIENMAQTAAAGVGAEAAASGKDAPVGFIGGIKNLRITGFPKTGQEITTRVTVLHQVFDATILQGEVFLEGKLIAACELKIFILQN